LRSLIIPSTGDRAEEIDTNEDAVRLSLYDAAVDEVDSDDAAVDRADDPEGRGRNRPAGIPKDQPEEAEQDERQHDERGMQVAEHQPRANQGSDQERCALAGHERVSASAQDGSRRIQNAARSSSSAAESTRAGRQ
jgi:hypothetical protein